MAKKLPDRSAKTYSRRQHQAETAALLQEDYLYSHDADPTPVDDGMSIAALMASTAIDDASPSEPTVAGTPSRHYGNSATTPGAATPRAATMSPQSMVMDHTVASKPEPEPVAVVAAQVAEAEAGKPANAWYDRLVHWMKKVLVLD